LSALSLHLQLLDEKLVPQADAETRETMQVLQSEIARIISVLSGFREYASVLTIHHDLTDLGSIVQRTAALVRPQADRSGVRIQVTLGSGSLLISADAGLLEQVMLNLVLNALDVMPDGGELRLEARNDGERMRLTVQDTGGGIQPELHSRLFDPFFTTKPNGSGMGLALCEKIVREHGGEIDYHTSPEGTRFDVMLPCRPPCPPPAGEPGCPSCDDKVS
jgi:signal transduction histidine kinase